MNYYECYIEFLPKLHTLDPKVQLLTADNKARASIKQDDKIDIEIAFLQ